VGGLIQIDGSEHRWFEDRASLCALLVFVDDATSALMELRFVASESTLAYFEALKRYLAQHAKPVALYSDKHSIFRVSNEDATGGDGMTQFGRALSELNIEILCANSSQAKGGLSGLTTRCKIVWSRSYAGRHQYARGRERVPANVHGGLQ
jgi:hypothetical protein